MPNLFPTLLLSSFAFRSVCSVAFAFVFADDVLDLAAVALVAYFVKLRIVRPAFVKGRCS